MTTTKAGLRQEIAELRHVGEQMSNVCFNLAQKNGRVLGPRDTKTMDDLRRQWDSIKRRERKP